MNNLYQFLVEVKGYTDAEAEETVIRCDCGMPLPNEVRKDWEEFYNQLN